MCRMSLNDVNRRLSDNWWLLTTTCLSVIVGCNDGRIPTYPVVGTVLFENGDPVRFGVIEFLPVGDVPSARGKIDPEGSFSLTTFEGDDGAAAGKYRVIVIQPFIAPVGKLLPRGPRTIRAEHAEHQTERNIVPERYSNPESSDLEVVVEARPDNVVQLTLAHSTDRTSSKVDRD